MTQLTSENNRIINAREYAPALEHIIGSKYLILTAGSDNIIGVSVKAARYDNMEVGTINIREKSASLPPIGELKTKLMARGATKPYLEKITLIYSALSGALIEEGYDFPNSMGNI